jgi:elongation factor 1-beta
MSVATLPSNFETRNTGVFSVICLKSEPKFTIAKKAVVATTKKAAEDSDDDVDDLFGDDDEEEDISDTIARKIAADKELQARMKMKAEKAKKKGPEKTMFVFDVKPFDTETDLEALAKTLKATTLDGIVCWGEEHKFLPVAFGIKKLRISMIVEDEKVCQDDLEDHINADGRDDQIQSIDLYTMSKV